MHIFYSPFSNQEELRKSRQEELKERAKFLLDQARKEAGIGETPSSPAKEVEKEDSVVRRQN